MIAELCAKPLDRFPAIRSSDPAEIEHTLISVYGARRLRLPDRDAGLAVRGNIWQSRTIGLSYCGVSYSGHGGNAEVEFPAGRFYRQMFPLHGAMAIKIDGKPRQVTASETPVIPPGTMLVGEFAADYEQLGLRIDTDTLMRRLTAMTGEAPKRPLAFEPTTQSNCLGALQRLLRYFTDELDRTEGLLPPLIMNELEKTVVRVFLCSNPNNYTALLNSTPKPIASWQVRRAEEYIEAHWQEPLSVEALARMTSTSARSLFFHFKQSRGKSPMEFVKEVRLRHAQRLLSEGQTSVTKVAFACGFGNLGHFAKGYSKQFGELPSETVKRAKGQLDNACELETCHVHAADIGK